MSYSGGKDSDVILQLVKETGIPYRAIYKSTTIDPPGTIKHCEDNGVEIMRPKMSFLKLIEKKGMPTRRARFCCEVLKEYKVLDNAVQGIRRSESSARSKRYSEDDPIICRIYGRSKKKKKDNHCNVCLPILSWTDEDVKEFIEDRKIRCHSLYYDEDGAFRVERRLGCIGCPMQNNQGKKDYKEYPKLLRQVVKAAKKWWDTHPNASSHQKFDSIYGLVSHNIFFHSYDDWYNATYTLTGKTDWKAELEEYFNVKLE